MYARSVLLWPLLSLVVVGVGRAEATPLTVEYFDPVTGWEWASLTETINLSWNQVTAACSQDGVTPCSSDIGALEFTGWTWATRDQVASLFDNATDLTAAEAAGDFSETNSTWAPQFFTLFSPTLVLSTENLVAGWSSTLAIATQAYSPLMIDVFGSTSFDHANSLNTSLINFGGSVAGVWLHREAEAVTPVPEPTTLILFGTGLAAAGVRRFRQRKL